MEQVVHILYWASKQQDCGSKIKLCSIQVQKQTLKPKGSLDRGQRKQSELLGTNENYVNYLNT